MHKNERSGKTNHSSTGDATQQLYQQLDKYYLDVQHASAFGSPQSLYMATKHIPGVTRRVIRDYLSRQSSFSRFVSKRKRFKRRSIVAFQLDDIWQVDLAQFDNISRYNKGIHYLLVVIDTLSSYLWVEPVKRKTGELVAQAFDQILKRADPRRPKMVFADMGLEFYNKRFMELLDKYHITLYSTTTASTKAAQAERAIRTLKQRMYRYMTQNRVWRYLDVLQNIVTNVNNSVNRTIRMTPASVTKQVEEQVFQARYKNKKKRKKPNFKIKQYVRTREYGNVFKKEFRPSFSKSIFIIKQVQRTFPNTYKLSILDVMGNEIAPINRAYYSPELVAVTPTFGQTEFQDPPKAKRAI